MRPVCSTMGCKNCLNHSMNMFLYKYTIVATTFISNEREKQEKEEYKKKFMHICIHAGITIMNDIEKRGDEEKKTTTTHWAKLERANAILWQGISTFIQFIVIVVHRRVYHFVAEKNETQWIFFEYVEQNKIQIHTHTVLICN